MPRHRFTRLPSRRSIAAFAVLGLVATGVVHHQRELRQVRADAGELLRAAASQQAQLGLPVGQPASIADLGIRIPERVAQAYRFEIRPVGGIGPAAGDGSASGHGPAGGVGAVAGSAPADAHDTGAGHGAVRDGGPVADAGVVPGTAGTDGATGDAAPADGPRPVGWIIEAVPREDGPMASDACGTLTVDSRGTRSSTGGGRVAQCWRA